MDEIQYQPSITSTKKKRVRKRCFHGRHKFQCKECHGSSFCQHNIVRYYCKECGGKGLCSHGRREVRCKQCHGSSLCIHDKRKDACRECRGSQFCIHGRGKYRCRDCKGKGVCIHDKIKRICPKCGGSKICPHGKQRQHCLDCGTGLCRSCGLYMVSVKGKLCSQCNPNSQTRKRYDENRIEMKMLRYLQEKLPESSIFTEQHFGLECGYKGKKFDCVINSRTEKQVIVIECDEHAHSKESYTPTCEWSRPFAAYDIFRKPILFIRWNPHTWKVNDVTVRASKNEKMEQLWKYVKPYISEEIVIQEKLKVTFLYYPTLEKNPIYEYSQDELDDIVKKHFSVSPE